METEKRIGDFRVNRKVSWGITFPQNLHTRGLIQKPSFRGLCTGFVHSVGVETRTLLPQPPDPFRQPRHRSGILVAEPVVSVWARGPRMVRQVGLDDDLLHLLSEAALHEDG